MAPEKNEDENFSGKSIFLAGSIEMGEADDWQTKLTDHLKKNHDDKDILIYNPRRGDWNSSWKQEISDPKFFEQVTWELDNIDSCDIAIVYFDKETKSPITLLELGKIAEMGKNCIVCCPEGFWRKGNVDIVCSRKNIPVVNSLEELCEALDKELSPKEYSNIFPFVKEAEVSAEEDIGYITNLHDSPPIKITKGDKNIIFVKEFEYIPDACHMGKIEILNRNLISGICSFNDQSTIKLNIKYKDSYINEEFILQKVSEDQEEKIILNSKE